MSAAVEYAIAANDDPATAAKRTFIARRADQLEQRKAIPSEWRLATITGASTWERRARTPTTVTLDPEHEQTCPICNGEGVVAEDSRDCSNCNGAGFIPRADAAASDDGADGETERALAYIRANPLRSDAELREAVMASPSGNGRAAKAIRHYVISRDRAIGVRGVIPGNWAADGSLRSRRPRRLNWVLSFAPGPARMTELSVLPPWATVVYQRARSVASTIPPHTCLELGADLRRM